MSRYERLCASMGGSPAHLLRTMEGVLSRAGVDTHANIGLELLIQLRLVVEELEREVEQPSAALSECACCCHPCTCACHECDKCDCGVKCDTGKVLEHPQDEKRTRTELLLMRQCAELEKTCKALQQELLQANINR